jgi:hypothetical protein
MTIRSPSIRIGTPATRGLCLYFPVLAVGGGRPFFCADRSRDFEHLLLWHRQIESQRLGIDGRDCLLQPLLRIPVDQDHEQVRHRHRIARSQRKHLSEGLCSGQVDRLVVEDEIGPLEFLDEFSGCILPDGAGCVRAIPEGLEAVAVGGRHPVEDGLALLVMARQQRLRRGLESGSAGGRFGGAGCEEETHPKQRQESRCHRSIPFLSPRIRTALRRLADRLQDALLRFKDDCIVALTAAPSLSASP